MFKMDESEKILFFEFNSDFKNSEKVITQSYDCLSKFGVTTSNDMLKNYILFMRELINNAVEHGNKKDDAKTIKCSFENIKNKRFKITVSDEGEGFDYQNVNLKMGKDASELRSRGFPLINKYVDNILFEDNGATVTVFYEFPTETSIETIKDKDGVITIKPSGDISANNSQELKKILMKCLDEMDKGFLFDMSNVGGVDSTGLSLFVVFSKMAKKKNPDCSLAIKGSDVDIMQLFVMTGLDKVYEIIP